MNVPTTVIASGPAPGRIGRSLALCLVLGAALACAGCNTTPRPQLPDQAETEARLREARALLIQAEQARKSGKNVEAIDFYRRSLGLDGNNPAAWNNLGILLIEQSDYMSAANALRAAADLNPVDPKPLQNLGLAYFKAGYDQEALRYYTESLERDPNWIESIRGVAMCSHRLNLSNDEILAILSRGLMVERDRTWRDTITREKIRVEQQLKAEREAARREGR
ncbi:MAG: tetratricopeptide repeat protein [Phycisphaerales bacterium]|nr:tetratricopeptide repeat protein [Phycisphaerales bacterium]